MRIVITGASGFIGKNLALRLRELGHDDIVPVTRDTTEAELVKAASSADCVFHLAGVNRPQDPAEFDTGNRDFTATLCAALAASGRRARVVYTSSTQAALDNPYGRSKRAAENALLEHARATGSPVHVFRLPNVFGKWCRPHYNSAVATFCHQIARGLPIAINDPAVTLRLIHIDDVVNAFLEVLGTTPPAQGFVEAGPVHEIMLGTLADTLREFAASRQSLVMPAVGTGLIRKLYSTYVSYLPPESFAYQVPRYGDPRGVFVEMLKTPDCGQFSYFTAGPGITRGEHYHHTKTEKFLVISGSASFSFRHLSTGETSEITVHGGEGRIVETIPGWVHKVSNVGSGELVVMLWANEVFDRQRPDTVAAKVDA